MNETVILNYRLYKLKKVKKKKEKILNGVKKSETDVHYANVLARYWGENIN